MVQYVFRSFSKHYGYMCASLVIYLDAVLNGYDFHRMGPIFTPYIAIFHVSYRTI